MVGKNFTTSARLKYGDQDISSSFVTIEKNTITFVLPSSVSVSPTENFVSASIEGNTSKSPLPLKLDLDRILPKIHSITPSIIKACDTVTLTGKNLLFDGKMVEVSNNVGTLTVLQSTNDRVVCIVKTISKEALNFNLFNGRFYTTSQDITVNVIRPEVISVSPLIYKPKDIITLKIKNFPYCDNAMQAAFKGSNTPLEILSKSKDEIRLQLPEECFGYAPIVITLFGNYYTNSDNQQFETPTLSPAPPEVHSIVPSHGSFGDEIVITGNKLKGTWIDMLDTISITDTEIRGTLNQYASIKDNGFTDVTIWGCGMLTLENAFTYDPIVISDFTPKIVTSLSQQLIITGKNFSTAPFKNTITIGAYTVSLSADNPHTLTVPISVLLPITQSVTESVSIIVKNSMENQGTSSAPLKIEYEAAWSQLNDYPFSGLYLGINFGLDGKGYIGTGNDNKSANFWQYDPTTDTWRERAPYRGRTSGYRRSATVNGKAYVGLDMTYYNEWWEYDPTTDLWTRKKDYPGPDQHGTFAFELGDKVYVGSGETEFWEYNPVLDSWTRKADMPSHNSVGSVNFGFKGKGYVYGTSSNGAQYENTYDPDSNTWTSRLIKDFERSANNNYMIFQDFVVVGGESLVNYRHNTFLKIVPGTGDFEATDYVGIRRKGPIGFSIGEYGYWGLGLDASTSQGSIEIWRFKASQLR